MGTWGTGLFSDDNACDVRDDYRLYLAEGFSGSEATDRLIQEYEINPKMLDTHNTVFWLALASVQWQAGRLEQRVKDKAIKIINTKLDLARWESNSNLMKRRSAVLKRLRQKLEKEQPRKKKYSKRFRNATNWDVGDVISYRMRSDRIVLFRVIGYHKDKGGTSPVFELLDWVGEYLPRTKMINNMNYLKGVGVGRQPTQFLIGRFREKELPHDRITLVIRKSKPSQQPGGYRVYLWSYLDELLEKDFGLT